MILFFLIVLMYFAFSWVLPWHLIDFPISLSYVFDLFFAVGLSFIFRINWGLKWRPKKDFWIMLTELSFFALLCISVLWFFDIPSPFRLVDNVGWHMLVLAPILEELVFRQTLQRVLIKQVGEKSYTSLISALVFAISHLIAIKILPSEYIPFVGFQFFYTFVLALFCGHAMKRFHSILPAILMHFIFNLIFWIGLEVELF